MGRHGLEMKCKCEVWGVKSAMWSGGKSFLDFALHRGRAQVMFWDNNTATASHKARTHGPGWRTAHASSLVVLGSDSWKLRWHMRRDELGQGEKLRWDEVWSVKSAVWSVGREECSVKFGVWSVKCGVWRKQWEVRSVKCGLWSVKCGVWSVKSVEWEECSVKCGVWSVECEVWSVKSAVRSVKRELELQMWHVKQDTHGLGWRTAHASSIVEKGLIYP